MQTIGQALGNRGNPLPSAVNELPNVGYIGLELELEGPRSFTDIRGWERKGDGSLRDGVEYVFEGPAAGRNALERILSMGEALRTIRPEPTFRCSTHIHLDVRDLDFVEYDKLVATYAMFEHVLFDHCSPERRYSNFCTPFFVSDGMIRQYGELFKRTEHPVEKLRRLDQWSKYTGLNLKVTRSYGSVEFRGSHALTTSEELLALSQRVLHLKRLVKEFSDENESTLRYIERLRGMTLGDIFPTGLNQGYARAPEDEDAGYSNALLLATRPWAYDETRRDVPQAGWGETRANQRGEVDPWVDIDVTALDRYNISRESLSMRNGQVRFSTVCNLVAALRQIQGMEPPRFSNFINIRRVAGANGAGTILSQLGRAGLTGGNWN